MAIANSRGKKFYNRLHSSIVNILGKNVPTPLGVKPEILFVIQRQNSMKFFGADIWNAYEFSWLSESLIPQVTILRIDIPVDSPNIIESKSLKLYLNGFQQTCWANWQSVQSQVALDLSKCAGKEVSVGQVKPDDWIVKEPPGQCIDKVKLELPDDFYNKPCQKEQLAHSQSLKAETLYTHLFKSNCPVTNQPDWATIIIDYKGPQIEQSGLLKYLLSYRSHQDFHEQCIEKIYQDILQACKSEELTVVGRFCRRGGIDINPLRSTNKNVGLINKRLFRQ